MRTNGTVRWFNDAQDCGYIRPANGSRDCFVRGSALVGARTLGEGEEVEFEVVVGANGPRAIDVRRVTGGRRHV